MKRPTPRRTWLLTALAIIAGATFATLGPTSTAVAVDTTAPGTVTFDSAYLSSNGVDVDVLVRVNCEAAGNIDIAVSLSQAVNGYTAKGQKSKTHTCSENTGEELVSVPVEPEDCGPHFQKGTAKLTLNGTRETIDIK
jgi:hypothetical protein